MSSKYLIITVASRISYVIIALFAVLFRINYPSELSYIFMLVAVVYIAGFEIFAQITRKSVRKTLKNTVSVMNLDAVQRLGEFPLPVIVCDDCGDILWYSECFVNLVGDESLSHVISVKSIDKNILSGEVSSVVFSGKSFTVYVDKDNVDGKTLYIIYFFDITDYTALKREQQLLKPVVAYVTVDNYDELFRNVREGDTSVAMAKIDDALMQWASKTDGIIKKTDKNRYLFIFENRFLSDFTSDRFDILETVRELPILSTFPPTLSIGIGLERSTFSANDDAARKALDMALSRGGDQVVISKTTGFEFYGGYAKMSDTRAKIRSRVLASSFAEVLDSVEKVIVMGHRFADMDSLGACVGIACIANSRNKKVNIVLDTEANLAEPLYDRLITSERHKNLFISHEEAMMTVDLKTLVVMVDTHRGSYTEMPELLDYAGKIAVIDHHRKATDYVQNAVFFFHEPYASSTCEMITEIMEYLGNCNPTQLEAEALLAGIYLDTKNFSLKTGTCTFEASAFLKTMGASTVNVKLMFQTDMETYRGKAEIVRKTQIYQSVFAISTCDFPVSGNIKIASSQAADEMLNIDGVQASFTVYESKGVCYFSARSFGNVNVQLIMEKLGGGGHQTMAGAQLGDVNIKEAYIKLTNVIDSYLEEQGR